jgi:hypothetical protein
MRKALRILALLVINLAVLILLSELVFTGYYFHKDGQYLSVAEKLAQEKSSFEVEKQKTIPCNKYNNVLAPHPYLTFIHVSRPECNSFANNTGHRGPDVPLVKNDRDYVVMILGGSVANQLFQFEQAGIQQYFQKKHPDKNVVILNGSLEGWKQPQQLFMLQMYGEVIDAAISIEGFNEMIFDRRLDYRLRFDAPFLPGYRKANAGFLTDEERSAIWMSSKLFDLVNNSSVLRHSKTAYFFSDLIRSRLEQNINRQSDLDSFHEGALQHLEKIFVLPDGWSSEQRRDFAIAQYIKYLSLMNATAKQYHIPIAIFLQPAPAIDKPLSDEERKLVDDLGYRDDYLLFEQQILKHSDTLPVYSLLHVFSGIDEAIYKDGIHYRQDSSGSERVMTRIYQVLDTAWPAK